MHEHGQRIGIGQGLLCQFRQVGDAGARDQTELGEMSTQSVRQHGALSHEKGSSTMGHEDTLLLDRLDRHEPHRRALHGLADRFGIKRVALAALE